MGHSREKDDKDDKKRKYKDDDERSDRDKRSRYDEKDRRDKDRDSDRKRRDDKDDRSSSRKDEKDRKREKDSKRDEKSSKDEKTSTEKSPPAIVKEVVKELTPEEKAKREQEEKEKQLKEEEMRKRREKWLKAKETILKEQLDAQLQGKQETQNKENIPQPMVIEPPLQELPSVTTPPAIEEPIEVEIPVIDKEKAAEEARKKIEDANINMRPMDEEKELVKRQTSVTEADSELAEEDGNETTTNPTANTDEVDPLDAFMTGITKEVEELSKKDEEKLKKLTIDQSSIPEYVEEEVEAEPEPVDEEQALLLKIKTKVLPTIDHSQMEYIEFSKNFYNEVPELARMTPEEVLDYREELGITVKGKRCPKPIKFFHQCGLSERILAILNKHGFQKPTPIQAQAIPAIMSGRDVIGCAPTGSGKTLAFLLPMLRHVTAQPPLRPGDGPIALLMAPTRELAVQIFNEVRKFTRILELNVAAVYGGSGMSSQIADLKRGAEIVVCTPGRMIDVLSLNSGKVTNLRRVTYLVLDEADRMFDTGFEHQIMRMVANTRPDRQTVMFSATFPVQMEQVARQARNTKPIEITVGQRSVVNKDVTQLVYVMPPEQKFKKLLEVLKEHASEEANINVLIFVNTQDEGERLNSELMRAGYTALVLHSGKDQEEREFIIDDFKRKIKNIMIATSIASRGLDVEDLRLVVNWDPPNHMEDYVHRSGRTGRAGKKGTAVTLISTDDERYAGSIMRALERSGTPVPEELKKLVETFNEKKKEGKVQAAGSGYGGKGFQFNEEEARRKMEERKAQKRAAGIEDEEEDDEEVEYDPETDELIVKPKPKPEPTPENSNPNAIPSKEDLNAKIAAIVQKVKASVSGMGDAGVMDELEINDYPQMARWRITRKEALQSITELTGTAITTKGTYYPPGKNPSPGDRKLYLQIEGPDAATVKMARTELLRILSETEFTGAEMSMMGRQGKFKI